MKKRNVIILVVMLIVGFATVTSTLVINGVLNIGENSDDFKIIFTSAKIDGTKRNDLISEDKTVINYETKTLTTIDEESILDYEVTNTSRNYDAEVDIVCNIVDETGNAIEGNNIYVDMTYEPNKMGLLSGETKKGKITTRLIKAVTEPMNINIKCTLTGTPKERNTLGDEYIDLDKTGGTLMVRSSNVAFWQHKTNITKVVFENTLTPHETSEELIYDVSEAQDKSVMSYLVPNEEDTTKYTLYINSDGKILANKNSSYLFYEFSNLQEIEHIEYLDTSNVTNMNQMFSICRSLTTLDLSSFNTNNVTDMYAMFQNCRRLMTLDLSSFDTSNITGMSGFFLYCESLTTLDLSSFNTNNVTDMGSMFQGCSSLITLDLSNFDTNKVTDMGSMFHNCTSLTNLDLSNFNTSNVTDMDYMFFYCSSLTTLDLKNFNTSNVTDMRSMFERCSNLKALNLSSFYTDNVTNMSLMFAGCSSLIILDISNFNTSKVTKMREMFVRCSGLTILDISSFDTSNVEDESYMFYLMSDNVIVKVKDKTVQDRIIALQGSKRPAAWTTENVIIKEA